MFKRLITNIQKLKHLFYYETIQLKNIYILPHLFSIASIIQLQAQDTDGDGFDTTQTGNPSIFTYDAPTQDFEAIPNTNVETLFVGMPFAILIRGGRDMDLNQSNFEVGDETTLRFAGELLTGPQSATGLSTASGGFSFLANPYQAQIDLGELLLNDATDIQSTKVWIYDPRQAGAFGKYVLVEYDASGNYDTATPNSAFNGFLQPNQSFFVQNATTATPSPSLTFREPQKIDATQTTAVFNTNPDTDLTVAMDLYASDEDDLRDGIIVRIADNYSDAVNDEDGVKFWNFLESMATFQNGEYLTSDRRQLDENDELVQLYISNYGESNYNFKIDVNNPDNEEVYLIDNYLDTETQLVALYQEHSFSVDASVPSSIDPNRFQLNFEQSTLGNDAFETSGISIYPNPVKDVLTINLSQFTGEVNSLSLYDITGKLVNHQNMTNANTEQEINLENYARGIYVLHIDTKNSQYQHKLIKK